MDNISNYSTEKLKALKSQQNVRRLGYIAELHYHERVRKSLVKERNAEPQDSRTGRRNEINFDIQATKRKINDISRKLHNLKKEIRQRDRVFGKMFNTGTNTHDARMSRMSTILSSEADTDRLAEKLDALPTQFEEDGLTYHLEIRVDVGNLIFELEYVNYTTGSKKTARVYQGRSLPEAIEKAYRAFRYATQL